MSSSQLSHLSNTRPFRTELKPRPRLIQRHNAADAVNPHDLTGNVKLAVPGQRMAALP